MNDGSTKGNASEVAATEASSEANPIDKESIMSDCTQVAAPGATVTPDLAIVEGQITTTSQQIAGHFGKRHADVIRAIRKLDLPSEFNQRNFALVETIDAKGEKRPAYNITRDGFTLLAMGFTGKEATHWKLAYITAFNKMESELLGRAKRPYNPAIDYDRISPAQAQDLKQIVEAIAKAGVQGFSETWARLHRKFQVNSYLELPATRHLDARNYLIAKLPKGNNENLVDGNPRQDGIALNSDRLDQAFQLASQAAAQVQRAVFNCVMEGKEPISLSNHWELYFHQKNWGDKATDAYCKPLASDAICMGPDEYLTSLESGEGHILSMERLARMAALSSKKIADRFRQQASVANGAITKDGRHDVLKAC